MYAVEAGDREQAFPEQRESLVESPVVSVDLSDLLQRGPLAVEVIEFVDGLSGCDDCVPPLTLGDLAECFSQQRAYRVSGRRHTATIGLGRAVLSRLTDATPWTVLCVNTDRPLFWLLARRPYLSVEELKGRRIAIHPPHTMPGWLCRIVLRRLGLDPDRRQHSRPVRSARRQSVRAWLQRRP